MERLWVRLIDSDLYRKHMKYGIGSALLKSRPYRSANRTRRYLLSLFRTYTNPKAFSDVQTYCTFIGHNKSGTTMLGSLIDAHPNAILADEADAVQYVSAGFRRDQIFHLLLQASRRDLLKGRVTARRLGGYDYLVPGQWQGRYSRLRVIGDSTSGSTTLRLADDPGLIKELQGLMPGVATRFIQVVRNPFDPIAAMMVRGKRTFADASGHYFAGCEALMKIRKVLPEDNLHVVRYEDFVRDSAAGLRAVCAFLGLDPDPAYIQSAVSILYAEPDRLRTLVEWKPERIHSVEERLQAYPFLAGYAYADEIRNLAP